MTPGTYLQRRRAAAGLSLDDVAARIGTEPHLLDQISRVEWLARLEADVLPIDETVLRALYPVFPFDVTVVLQLTDSRTAPLSLGGGEPPRLCRECACSEHCACFADDVGCHWVEPDLCSSCANRRNPTPAPRAPAPDEKGERL